MAQLQKLSPQHKDMVLNAIKQQLQPAPTTPTTPAPAQAPAPAATPAPVTAPARHKSPDAKATGPKSNPTQTQLDVFSALKNVGFSKDQAAAAIRSAIQTDPKVGNDFDALMRASLQFAQNRPQFKR